MCSKSLDLIHEKHIDSTYEIAIESMNNGNHPFGALLVIDNEVVLTAENTVVTEKDVTKHAELNLVSMATKRFDSEALSKSILYTSTEPCAMCTGAIFWSGISAIVYGCPAEELGKIAGEAFVIPCREILKYGNRNFNVIGPVLKEKGVEVHKNFW